jgi:hypothetical protein
MNSGMRVYTGTWNKNVAKSVDYQYRHRHNETLVMCANAHARFSGAWKWISKNTKLNQSVAVKFLKDTSVRMRMIKMLRSINYESISFRN